VVFHCLLWIPVFAGMTGKESGMTAPTCEIATATFGSLAMTGEKKPVRVFASFGRSPHLSLAGLQREYCEPYFFHPLFPYRLLPLTLSLNFQLLTFFYLFSIRNLLSCFCLHAIRNAFILVSICVNLVVLFYSV